MWTAGFGRDMVSGMASPGVSAVRCKVCDVGTLSLQSQHRMSKPVVAIGYIFLIPSVLGIAVSAFAVLAAVSASGVHEQSGMGLVLLIPIFFGVASFIAGLFGWLLIMKKDVLRCGNCRAIVNAS